MLRTIVCALPSIRCFTSSSRVGGTGGVDRFAGVVALLGPALLRFFLRSLRLRVSFSDVQMVSLSHFVLSALHVNMYASKGVCEGNCCPRKLQNEHK